MGKFIIFTFLMLGVVFYELSDGADFVPETRVLAEAEPVEDTPVVEVTRAAPASLISVALPTPQAEVIAVNLTTPPEPEAPVAAETSPAVIAVNEPEPIDFRVVAGSRVNMRRGPSTDFGVVDTLPGGTTAEVLEVNANGWARVRILATGAEGWMAERLLADS